MVAKKKINIWQAVVYGFREALKNPVVYAMIVLISIAYFGKIDWEYAWFIVLFLYLNMIAQNKKP